MNRSPHIHFCHLLFNIFLRLQLKQLYWVKFACRIPLLNPSKASYCLICYMTWFHWALPNSQASPQVSLHFSAFASVIPLLSQCLESTMLPPIPGALNTPHFIWNSPQPALTNSSHDARLMCSLFTDSHSILYLPLGPYHNYNSEFLLSLILVIT